MKNKILIAVLMMLCFAAHALTTFTYFSRFNDGTTNFNAFVLSAYPPASPFTTDGTNTFFGAFPETNTPTASGWLTNAISAGLYTLTYPAFPQYGVFVNVANTTVTNNISLYYTNVPAVPTFAGYILNTYTGVSNAVQFVIATNGGAIGYTQLPFTPPTNTVAGLNFVYGLPPTSIPATNTDPRIVLAVTNTTALWGTNVMLVRLLTAGLSLTNSYTTNSDNSVTLNIGMAFQAATNILTLMTGSNPTNSYATGTLYTNGNFKSFLTGYATGGILNYTNNATAYILPLTNDFCVPLTTNTTFSIIGGTVTNVVNWQ